MQPLVKVYQHPNPLFMESFDDILTKLITGEEQKEGAQVLAFCGSDPGVGTTTVVINLAISFSLAQRKVLLIDEDMRKVRTRKHLSSNSLVGLSDYLQGDIELQEILCKTNYPNLEYLPGGNSTDHPQRLLGSGKFKQLMERLARDYDYILIDTPSIAAANDLAAIASMTDRVFAIAEPNRSRKKNLANIWRALGNDADEKIDGVIVNKVDGREYRSYRMYYDYFDKKQNLMRKRKKS